MSFIIVARNDPVACPRSDTERAVETSEEEAYSNAAKPWGPESPKADAVLRSSDNVDFYVSKAMLCWSSPFFSSVFSDAKPDILKDGFPVVVLDDDSRALRALLPYCYPRPISHSLPFDDFSTAVTAASKYCMDNVLDVLEESAYRTCDTQRDPVRWYTIAIQHRWKRLARKAALEALTIPLQGRCSVPELRNITALDLHRLHEYHWACSRAAVKLVSEQFELMDKMFRCLHWVGMHRWLESGLECPAKCGMERIQIVSSPVGSLFTGVYTYKWFLTFLDNTAEKLRQRPSVVVLEDEAIIDNLALCASACPRLRPTAYRDARGIVEQLKTALDREIRKIPLVLD